MTSYINNNEKDRNARAIINHFNNSSTKRVRPSICDGSSNIVDSSNSDGFMTLSDIRIQDFVGYHQGGVGANKDNSVVCESGSLSHCSEPNKSVERAADSYKRYNFLKEIEDRSIDNRNMLEPTSNHQSHEGTGEEEEEEEEEEEDAADTAPILACTRVITPHRLRTWNTSKTKTNDKNKIISCNSGGGCDNKITGWMSDPKTTTTTAHSRNNNNTNYKNSCTVSRYMGDNKVSDGSHLNSLQLPPPLISNHHPQNNLPCYLDESRCLTPAEVFVDDVSFVNNSQIVSHRQNPNFSIAATAGIYQNNGHENLPQSGSTFLKPVVSSSSSALVSSTSLFNPATTPTSVVIASSNMEGFGEGSSEGGLKTGHGRGNPLPPTEDRGTLVSTNTCSFGSSSSASGGAGSATTSSTLPAWTSPHAMGEHCHPSQANINQVDKLARNQLIAVSVLCVIFMSCEAVGGVLSNSLALFTDVLHLGSDLISFFIGLLALFLSTKPATESMSFGYHRLEILGAVISVLMIWLVTGILCYVATERIIRETYKDVHADEMLITAILGVFFNVVMGCILHLDFCCKSAAAKTHGHSHSHLHNGHSGGTNSQKMYQRLSQEPTENTPAIMECQSKAEPRKNVNIRAATIHVIGDIIQSVGVLVAALIIKFTEMEKYRLADPICTFVFSIIVLYTTVNVLRDTLRVIMEGVPQDINYKKLRSELETLDHVKMVHSLCVWSLTLNKNAISVHLALDEVADSQTILEGATAMLRKRYNFHHTTIQVERYIPIMSQCPECLMPV